MKDWKKVKLGTLLTESKVESTSPDPDKRISVKLNVNGVEKRPLTKDKKGATKYFIRKAGQFIYGKQNLHKGAFGIVPEELDGYESSSDIPAFDVDESCYPEWIYYFFKKGNFYLKLESLAKGVGSKRIHPHQIFDLDIFLPEKDEQKEILDQITAIENNHEALISEIDSQETLLTQLRQSILQDAIQGKLTAEWRKQNSDIEPASELLKRIQAEKEQLIKEKKIKRAKESGTILKNEFKAEYNSDWVIAKIVDLCFVTKLAGFEYTKYFDLQDIGEIPVIRAQNVKPNRIDETNLKFIDKATSDLLQRCALTKPAILMTFIGAGIGDTAVFNKEERWHLAPNVAKLEPFNDFNEKLDVKFLQYYFMSPVGRSEIFKRVKATAQPNLSMGTIRDCIVILPPIKEQVEIIKTIDTFFKLFDNLNEQINNSIKKSEHLLQAVLIELLGEENTITQLSQKETKTILPSREIKYDGKTTLMELVELLTKHGRLHAEDLWKMSKFPEDIDKFYAELKKQIEEKKSIKESAEKGYLELA